MTQDYNFAGMSIDALWKLHEELRIVLAAKMADQRDEIDERLRDIEQFATKSPRPTSSLQPKVGPVYRNPEQPAQIWSGRGLRPRWLVFQLAAGRSLEEFRVDADEDGVSETQCSTDGSDRHSEH